tara:strand:- start:447 stop:659 length:213 start_codon:yes stop_codon:yes gene_type:complete
MRMVWIFLFTLVIIDPYADIKYGEIDVYEYDEPAENQPKKKRKYRSKYRKKKSLGRIWCSMCDPPRWLQL